MPFIYGLFAEDNTCLYIGSTINYDSRISTHRSTQGTYGSCYSSHIPKDIVWQARVLEECEGKDKLRREAEYIRDMNPVYNANKMTTSLYRRSDSVWVKEGIAWVIKPGARDSRKSAETTGSSGGV